MFIEVFLSLQDYALVTNIKNSVRTLNIHTKAMQGSLNLTNVQKILDIAVFDKSIQLIEKCEYKNVNLYLKKKVSCLLLVRLKIKIV